MIAPSLLCRAVRIRAAAVTLATALFVAFPAQAQEESFAAFSDNVRKLNTLLLQACQGDETSFFNTSGITGDLQNIYNLRRACGQGMTGRAIEDSPYAVFFQFDPEAGGAVDFLGVTRKRFFGGNSYQVVIGWVTRRSEDSPDAELEASFAEALLLKQNPFGWGQVWSYVAGTGDDWNRIAVDTPEKYPQFSPAEVTFIHDLWSDALIAEFPAFVAQSEQLAVEK